MSRSLPPLNALRAFEAAARHGSFGRAATELHVTSAAISHHVKTLEEYLGVTLFTRTGRGLRLTGAGQAGLGDLSAGFAMLERGSALLRASGKADSLTVWVAPAFASRWLVPRLDHFSTRCPDLDVSLDARYDLPDFRAGQAQLAVHFSAGSYPAALRADRLLGVRVQPLCAPSYLEREGIELKQPEDLVGARLLHDETLKLDARVPDWDAWLAAAGVSGVDTGRGAHFSHALLALEATLDGQGVVLTYDFIAEPDLEAGRLLAPFSLSLDADSAYYVVCAEADADSPGIGALRDWLLEETRPWREASK